MRGVTKLVDYPLNQTEIILCFVNCFSFQYDTKFMIPIFQTHLLKCLVTGPPPQSSNSGISH